jgi:hypothetical protein
MCYEPRELLEPDHFISLGAATRSFLKTVPTPLRLAADIGAGDEMSTSVISIACTRRIAPTSGIGGTCANLETSEPTLRSGSRGSEQNSEDESP